MVGITYANGDAPDSALVFVDGIHLVPAIAPRVEAFIDFAKTQGKTVRVAHPYGGYRNFHEQGQLSGTGNSASTIPVAAAGHSTHGVYDVGRVDLVGADGYTYNAALLGWIVANAGAFGLVREFGTADPNHFMQHGDFTPDAATVTRKDDDMTYALVNATAGPELPGVPAGAVFIGDGTDPLVWVSNAGPEQLNEVVFASWDAKSIADRISQVGLRGSGFDVDKVFASMADAQARKPAYSLGGGSVTVGKVTAAADPALLAAVKENTTVLTQLLAATKALNPPG